jgi:D-amino-acid dehydrogenase
MDAQTGRHVAVIGAGVVGAICAIEALRDGRRVTVIEPGAPGGPQAASYGNAGWLGTHSVIPPAEPGLWRRLPALLMDPLGPLAIRWPYLPRSLPWLMRYLWSGWTEAQVERTAHALRALLRGAPVLHERLAEEAGLGDLIEHRGLMHIYTSREAFEADGFAWDIRRRTGVDWLELSEDEMRQRQPDLDRRYRFGVLVEDAGCCRDPGAYVAGLADHARALGTELVAAAATGFRMQDGRLKAVITDRGEIACDAAVIAAGIHSKPLCASLGDRLPLETERGYHVTVEGASVGPRVPVMASDTKMGVNWMTTGLRAAGQVEIAGLDAAPDWRRAQILRNHLIGMFPALPRDLPQDKLHVWLGHRPSMPDGRPCIGHARATRDVVYAFGHGHIGLAASARTGRLVAQLIAGRETEIPVGPFDPRRYL